MALGFSWDRRGKWAPSAEAESFPIREPESSVVPAAVTKVQRASCFGSKLVLDPWRARFAHCIQKEIIRIEHAIPQILVDLAANKLRSALRAQVSNSSCESAPLRGQIAGVNFELLNRILDGNQYG